MTGAHQRGDFTLSYSAMDGYLNARKSGKFKTIRGLVTGAGPCKMDMQRQVTEDGTRVGHDIAHPGHWKVQIRAVKTDKTAPLVFNTIEIGSVALGNSGNKGIVIPGMGCLTNHILQVNTAACALGPLTDNMQDFEGVRS